MIYIHFPFDESKGWDKEKEEYYLSISPWVEVNLPFVPRIGEKINIEFLGVTDYFKQGYVHNVEHNIESNRQLIYIDVHPLDNDYARWEKLKEKYERGQM